MLALVTLGGTTMWKNDRKSAAVRIPALQVDVTRKKLFHSLNLR
jgi:hypothetical protein